MGRVKEMGFVSQGVLMRRTITAVGVGYCYGEGCYCDKWLSQVIADENMRNLRSLCASILEVASPGAIDGL